MVFYSADDRPRAVSESFARIQVETKTVAELVKFSTRQRQRNTFELASEISFTPSSSSNGSFHLRGVLNPLTNIQSGFDNFQQVHIFRLHLKRRSMYLACDSQVFPLPWWRKFTRFPGSGLIAARCWGKFNFQISINAGKLPVWFPCSRWIASRAIDGLHYREIADLRHDRGERIDSEARRHCTIS